MLLAIFIVILLTPQEAVHCNRPTITTQLKIKDHAYVFNVGLSYFVNNVCVRLYGAAEHL